MDCKTALRLLEVCRPSGDDVTDRELAPAVAHLEQCTECLGAFRMRQSFDARVAEVVRATSVPAGLRDRIIGRLQRGRARHAPRTVVVWGSAAAALLLVAFGVYWLRPQPAGPVELAPGGLPDLVVQAEHEIEDERAVPAELGARDQITDWCMRELSRLRLTATPPEILPVSGPAAIARARLPGYTRYAVAVFRYADPRAAHYGADVFAFPRSQFTISELDGQPRRMNTTLNPSVIAWVEGDTVYVAVFKGWLPKEWERLPPLSRSNTVT